MKNQKTKWKKMLALLMVAVIFGNFNGSFIFSKAAEEKEPALLQHVVTLEENQKEVEENQREGISNHVKNPEENQEQQEESQENQEEEIIQENQKEEITKENQKEEIIQENLKENQEEDTNQVYLEENRKNPEESQENPETSRTAIKQLYIHSRVGGETWKPNMDLSDERLRQSLDFYVRIENTSANELVGDAYTIQWFQDGNLIQGTPKDAGEYTVKITLDDSLSEVAEMAAGYDSFSFKVRKMSLNNAILGLYGESSAVWTGNPVLPQGAYVANSSYTMPEDTYELQFIEGKNCTEVGTGYVNLVGKGPNVEGEKELTYQIQKQRIDLTSIKQEIVTSFTYDGTGKHAVLENSYEGIASIEYSGYHTSNWTKLEEMPVDVGNYKCFVKLIPEDTDHYYSEQWYQDYEITPLQLEVDTTVEKSRVYDTSTNVKTPEVTIKNLVKDDIVILSAQASYDTKHAGKNKTITVTYKMAGLDASNYIAPEDFSLTDGEIIQKEATVENIVLQSYYYNGKREVPLDQTTITNMDHWVLVAYSSVDDVSLDKSEVKAFMEDADVGVDKPVTFTGLKLAGADSGNYVLIQPKTTVTIRKVEFPNAIDIQMESYQYGSAVPTPSLPDYKGDGEITYKYREVDSGEEYQEWKEIEPETLKPGNYEMIAEVTETTNYRGGTTSYPKKFSVNRFSPEISGTENWEKIYGDKDFYLDITQKGDGQISYQVFKGNDVVSVAADGKVSIDKAGDAIIKVSTTQTDTYQEEFMLVNISVAKAKGSASITQEGWVYHPQNNNAKLPVSVSETNGTDFVTYQYKRKDAKDENYQKEIPVKVGTYTVKALFPATENYNAVSVETDFTITKAKAQISGAERYIKTYGDQSFVLNISKIGEGNLKYALTSGKDVINIKENGLVTIKKAGTALITVSMAATENYYAAEEIQVEIVVSKAKGEGSVTLEDWEYSPDNKNANVPVVKSKTNGTSQVSYQYKLKNAEDSSYTNRVPATIGTYTVKAVFSETENYQEVIATADFRITKATPSLSIREVSKKTYGEADFNLQVSKIGESEVTYRSDNKKVITVTKSGKVHIEGAGTAIITAHMEESNNYYEISKKITIDVEKAKGEGSVTLKDWEYSPDNKNANVPVAKSETNGINQVSYEYKQKTAKDSSYTKEVPINAGDYTVKATFGETENYHKVIATADFTILKKEKPDNTPIGKATKIEAAKDIYKIKDISLPEGWAWKNRDENLIIGGIVTATAIYQDTVNYKRYEIQIQISKQAEIIVDGTDFIYTIGKDTNAIIQCTGVLSELKSVAVDGIILSTSNYTLKEGSTILSINGEYLNTLSVKKHKIRLSYTAGDVETILTVTKAKEEEQDNNENKTPDNHTTDNHTTDNHSQNGKETDTDNNSQNEKTNTDATMENTNRPATGDNDSIELYILLLLLSAAVIITSIYSVKNKSKY
ncbi:MAG: hypothetical protein K1V96_01030 [Lachnospiraceae bacterium]